MECIIGDNIVKSMKNLDKILRKIKIIKKCICLPSYYKNNLISKANRELKLIELLVMQHDSIQHNLDDYCNDIDSSYILLCDKDMQLSIY